MCAPLVLVGVAMAATAASGIYSANQQNKAGKEQQKYYDYIAKQNDLAADAAIKVGDERAKRIEDQGSQDLKKLKQNVAQFGAAQQVAQTANGVWGGSVTAADIAGDTFDKGMMDEIAIRFNADQAAADAKTEATYNAWDLRNQRDLNKISGINARRTGAANANSTLFSTAASVASMAASSKMTAGGSAAKIT